MFYYTMHSPRGAGCSFVLGAENEAGGFMAQEGMIPENEVYIGILHQNEMKCLPFFLKEDAADAEENFDIGNTQKRKVLLRKYRKDEIRRTTSLTVDTWETEEITFQCISPARGIPDPDTASYEVLKQSTAPCIQAVFRVRNEGDDPVTGFFGVQGMKGVYPLSQTTNGSVIGAGCSNGYGFGMSGEKYRYLCTEIADFSPASAFSRQEKGFYQNCEMGGFCFEVGAGQEVEVQFVLGWFLGGIQTYANHRMPYYYTRYFRDLEDVLYYGSVHMQKFLEESRQVEQKFAAQELTEEQRFFIAQSVHCYWASTMLFDEGGQPRYIVNEGSYMMMNTFDLSVDHLFYECFAQSWCVKNQLAGFLKEYSYYDTLHDQNGRRGLPGGIAFTHDQGSNRSFTAFGYSCYEMRNKEGCLSYMSQEELLNWILCAAVYVEQSGDRQWLMQIQGAVKQCLESMMNRDDPVAELRDGIMDYDGDRCGRESEITTYDSLDEGLGQARRNLYLAVKCWAGYLAISRLTEELSPECACQAQQAALRCEKTIAQYYRPTLSYIPAILDGSSETAIIPAIEGLVYPKYFGYDQWLQSDREFIILLQKHLTGVLKPGLCLFDDGGWRLSSGSTNSWMSKIFLCEYIAEEILGFSIQNMKGDPNKAHVRWWKEQCARCPGIDQVVWGAPYGRGFHYPRAVTSVLWMEAGRDLFKGGQ